jgi:hypothetical protein
MVQWKIADSLDLTSITPRDWIQAIGARGGFLTALLTDEEREFVRIVYLPNVDVEAPPRRTPNSNFKADRRLPLTA